MAKAPIPGYRKGVTGIGHFSLQVLKSVANMTSSTCNLQESVKVTQECHLLFNAQLVLLCRSDTHHSTQLLSCLQTAACEGKYVHAHI